MKYAIALILAAVIAIPMQASAEKVDCVAIAELAQSVMAARQRNVSREAADAIVRRTDHAGVRVVGAALVSDAYREPILRTGTEREDEAREFALSAGVACLLHTR
jgi:NAD/NADP transhydrogenase alpha subunit